MSDNLADGRDIIDSREVIERIEELRNLWAETTGDDPDDYDLSGDDLLAGLSEDERDELVSLMEFRDEIAGYLPDWQYGETLVNESYWVAYVQELLEETGYLPENMPAWIHIDWAWTAQEVRADYTSGELNGVTYWGRS